MAVRKNNFILLTPKGKVYHDMVFREIDYNVISAAFVNCKIKFRSRSKFYRDQDAYICSDTLFVNTEIKLESVKLSSADFKNNTLIDCKFFFVNPWSTDPAQENRMSWKEADRIIKAAIENDNTFLYTDFHLETERKVLHIQNNYDALHSKERVITW